MGQNAATLRCNNSLYHLNLAERIRATIAQSEQQAEGVALPTQFGATAALLGYRVVTEAQAGEARLVTYWQAGAQVVTPLQLFVHAVAADGSIVAQEDRLDAPAYGWREGDLIAQVNRLALPDVSGPVWLQIGLYQPDSGERLPVRVEGRAVDQRLLLKQVTWPP